MNENVENVLEDLLYEFSWSHLDSIFNQTSVLSGRFDYDTDYDKMGINFPFLY